ncbi:MAG: citramalate synthase [Nitrospirae bacterium]|nr:citramalate synthase [Nitrospirota bacterium]
MSNSVLNSGGAVVEIYDTTLRDGTQAEDISLSVEDKLLITEKLDDFGVHYVEGGWPSSNPKDAEYFARVKKLKLRKTTVVAFGSTQKFGHKAEKDPNLRAIVSAETSVATIFGKTWDFHVIEALKISLDDNLGIIFDSIEFLKKHVKRVFFDAEHFYQGYANNPQYAQSCLKAAFEAGADCLVLCDTNGGFIPRDIRAVTSAVKEKFADSVTLGIHAHNDSDCAVANSLEAVLSGATQVQGTINGLGERCGNANLCSIVPNLQLKLGVRCLGDDELKLVREVSRYVNELANLSHAKRQSYVGDSAFAHKAGMHVSAVRKHPETYEHVNPELVGNSQRILISDLAGKSNIHRKAEEFGIHLLDDKSEVQKILDRLKDLESQGYQFEGAEASFELMMKRMTGQYSEAFELLGFRVIVEKQERCHDAKSEATIRIRLPNGQVEHTASDGNGPVNALDNALRKALLSYYPALKSVKLHDYKVRVLSGGKGTATGVRVLIESGDGRARWGTVGVSENVIEASWQALVDSIEYKLLKKRT